MLNSINQSFRDILIIYKINPSETNTFFIPYRIGLSVYDAGNSACYLIFTICNEKYHVAKLKSGIRLDIKRVNQVSVQLRNSKSISAIQVIVESDEFIQTAPAFYLLYSASIHQSIFLLN